MSSDPNRSGEGTETVGQKIDTLSVSVDERFDAVDVALVEQRQYTEFAFERLADEMRSGFEAIDGRLDGVDGQFKSVGEQFKTVGDQFKSVDDRFSSVDSRFDSVNRRLDRVDSRFDRVDSRFDTVDSRFDRLERKLDQFIDTQSTANKLVERRLTALGPRPAQE